jgi:hypothetical protein
MEAPERTVLVGLDAVRVRRRSAGIQWSQSGPVGRPIESKMEGNRRRGLYRCMEGGGCGWLQSLRRWARVESQGAKICRVVEMAVVKREEGMSSS